MDGARGTGSRTKQALLALAALAGPGTAHAQSVKPPTREELQAGGSEAKPAPAPSRLVVDSDIERGPCPLADPAYAAVKVTFARVDFGSLAAVPPAALEPAWRPFAGREVPVASLCEVRDRAATMLRQRGFLAAVQIPPQQIGKGGDVRMDVLVAKLVEVQLRGEAGHAEGLIAAYAARLKRSEYFNIREAERDLLLLGDLPGFDVRLTLRPAGKPGEVVGDLLVVRRPLEVVGGLQNLGSRAAGRIAVFAQATLDDLTGLGDHTELSAFNTVQFSEQSILRLEHDFALGSAGWRLGGSVVYGRSEPSLSAVKIRSQTVVGRIEASYPVIRRQALTLKGAAGAELVDQSVDFAGVRLSNDRLRVLFARADLDMLDKASLDRRRGYSASEPLWRIGASLEVRQGLGLLGASSDCTPVLQCAGPKAPISNFLADPRAFVVRLESVMEYRPVPALTVVLAPRAQYSPDVLLGYEQFSLGNYTIGRGLDPGTLQGDSGAGTSLELRYGTRKFGRSHAMTLRPYAFVDAGWAWNRDSALTGKPGHVLTAGGGMRMSWGDRIEANLMAALPFDRAGAQSRRGDVRLLFTLAARLAPWKST